MLLDVPAWVVVAEPLDAEVAFDAFDALEAFVGVFDELAPAVAVGPEALELVVSEAPVSLADGARALPQWVSIAARKMSGTTRLRMGARW